MTDREKAIREKIEASSLGTPGARALRARADRVRARLIQADAAKARRGCRKSRADASGASGQDDPNTRT